MSAGVPRAHPRSRGENVPALFRTLRWRGSSPLTRGKLIPVQGRFLVERLIPTHAGKTCEQARGAYPTPAHPRSCGENPGTTTNSYTVKGSSPLMRGKRLQQVNVSEADGLIPAHAGKTTPPPNAPGFPWAHPRSCGENSLIDVQNTFCEGSSPLMRENSLMFW